MKCHKKFCAEDKIRRQQKKEEKEACASIAEHMKEHENEESRVETIEAQRKLTRESLAESNTSGNAPQRNKYVLAEKCMICGRDSSWFYEDKVCYNNLVIFTITPKSTCVLNLRAKYSSTDTSTLCVFFPEN